MGIVRDGNCSGWELSGGNCPGWELSGIGIVRDGNCSPGGNCSGWELSGMGIVRIPIYVLRSVQTVSSSWIQHHPTCCVGSIQHIVAIARFSFIRTFKFCSNKRYATCQIRLSTTQHFMSTHYLMSSNILFNYI